MYYPTIRGDIRKLKRLHEMSARKYSDVQKQTLGSFYNGFCRYLSTIKYKGG